MPVTYNLDYGQTLHIMYFTDVSNAAEVTEKLTEQSYPFNNCTCINSKLILDSFQLAIAANKAVISHHSNNMITKSLPTELLFNLSLSENITGSLEKFGYGTRHGNDLLLAIFNHVENQCNDIEKMVEGTLHSNFDYEPSNLNLIKEAYDITDEQLSSSSLINLIVTKIACQSI